MDLLLGVLGLGHVGLPTALAFAELGWNVIGADDDHDKASSIGAGRVPFYEPELDILLSEHLASGRFQVVSNVPDAIMQADVLFVCVGTPHQQDGSADLSSIDQVAHAIAHNINGYKVIVEKSTTPAGTAKHIEETIRRYSDGAHDFDVAVNPEFLREGTAVRDCLHPDRIVIGARSDHAFQVLQRVYQPLLDRLANDRTNIESTRPSSTDRLVLTDPETAELIKHAANAFLATKISFINMLADMCDATGADVTEVARGLGLDPRIGPHFLQAGVGFGGYCLPKDLRAFERLGETLRVDTRLLNIVEVINEARVERLIGKLRQALWVLKGKNIALWGLTFKPGTDDIREAPSLRVVSRLLEEESSLRLYDPQGMPEFRKHFPEVGMNLRYCTSAIEAGRGADAIVVLTEWAEFATVDLKALHGVVQVPLMVDGRNCLDPTHVRQAGFEYYGMGR